MHPLRDVRGACRRGHLVGTLRPRSGPQRTVHLGREKAPTERTTGPTTHARSDERYGTDGEKYSGGGDTDADLRPKFCRGAYYYGVNRGHRVRNVSGQLPRLSWLCAIVCGAL